MKKTIYLLITLVLLASCKKENVTLLPQYQAIQGIWNLESVSYDSAGIRVSIQSRDRLRIEENLTYSLYIQPVNFVENGNISILDQSREKLKISFSAVYPAVYSFAGSRIFGFYDLELVSLSLHEMILRTKDEDIPDYPDIEYYFTK
ncbi:MAG: hypothetical protein ACM3NR_00300 [Methanosarcina sp.]